MVQNNGEQIASREWVGPACEKWGKTTVWNDVVGYSFGLTSYSSLNIDQDYISWTQFGIIATPSLYLQEKLLFGRFLSNIILLVNSLHECINSKSTKNVFIFFYYFYKRCCSRKLWSGCIILSKMWCQYYEFHSKIITWSCEILSGPVTYSHNSSTEKKIKRNKFYVNIKHTFTFQFAYFYFDYCPKIDSAIWVLYFCSIIKFH